MLLCFRFLIRLFFSCFLCFCSLRFFFFLTFCKSVGFFKDVKISREPSTFPDKVTIVIDVEEDRTGELSLGGGFSTSDGPLGDIRFAEHNFRGRGQDLSAGVVYAKRRQEFDISFTEPYFLDRELAAGIDLYRITQNKYFNQTFDQKVYGTTLRLGYNLAEDLLQQLTYTVRRDEIGDVKGDSSQFIKEQKGKTTLSEVGQTITYDKRDSRVNPTQGYMMGFSNQFAGLGGHVRYLKNSIFAVFGFHQHCITIQASHKKETPCLIPSSCRASWKLVVMPAKNCQRFYAAWQ